MTRGTALTAALGITILALLSLTVLPAQQIRSSRSQSLSDRDRIEIQQLVRKYAWALDSGDNYGYVYADLFTPDGVFVGMNQGPDGRSYQGRDQLAALARSGVRGATKQSHFTMNHVMTPTAEGAVGRAYVVMIDVGIVGQPNAVNHGGQYDDVYEKTSVGWRFKRRTYWESKADVNGVKP